ncbi:MAG: methyltransferase domain-containing protein [Stellaceae bacterium]
MAWWRGKKNVAPSKGTEPPHVVAAAAREEPPLDAPTLAQWLWGAGFHIPGDEAHVLALVTPFALNPAMSMLYLGAGLGGGARAIATKYATYVTALEADATLARRGMEMSTLQGMQRRAPVTAYVPDALELRDRSFDCILARQSTYALADKERLLKLLVTSLKPRGHLLITDYVLAPKAGGPALEGWRRQQQRPVQLWTAAQYDECLTRLGLDSRVAEDTTDDLRHLILGGWAQMINTIDLPSLPKQHLLAIVDEAERWVRTIEAIDAGALRTYRFYALAAAGPGPR